MKVRLAPFLVLIEARYAPLLFAVSPQAYAVYLWLLPLPYDLTGEIFAVLGALGFEFIYVGAIAWAEDEKASWWTWGTAAVALIFSVLVAYYVYRSQGAWALLHAGFPVVAFFYTMQLHGMTSRRPAHASQEAPGQTKAPQVSPNAQAVFSANSALPVQPPFSGHNDVFFQSLLDRSEPISVDEAVAISVSAPSNGHSASRYRCPHCKNMLASKQALGASVKNGHCPACRKDKANAKISRSLV